MLCHWRIRRARAVGTEDQSDPSGEFAAVDTGRGADKLEAQVLVERDRHEPRPGERDPHAPASCGRIHGNSGEVVSAPRGTIGSRQIVNCGPAQDLTVTFGDESMPVSIGEQPFEIDLRAASRNLDLVQPSGVERVRVADRQALEPRPMRRIRPLRES